MTGNADIINLLSRRLEWDESSITIVPKTDLDTDGYFEVTGTDVATQETIEGYLFLDDGIENEFNYSRYKKVTGNKGTFIAVFQNYEREKEIYNSTKKKSDEFVVMWESKVSVYLDSAEMIKLKVDQGGINYLENNNSAELEGYIFNISILEILKIIKPTGINLYRDNVRIGLSRNELSVRLRANFKDYILTGILEKEDFCKKYQIEERLVEQIIKRRNPELFWFSHNGITIYSKKGRENSRYKIRKNASIIELDPFKITVINGAQTITNLLRASEETKTLLIKSNKNIDATEAEKIVNEALDKMIVKAIIISGPDEYVSEISLGLNTQIPVGDNEKVVNMYAVGNINKQLEHVGIKIVRSGEYMDDFCMSPQKLVKMYFVANGEPGTARNLDTKNLEKYINQVSKEMEADKSIPTLMKRAVEADIWWNRNASYRINHSSGVDNIMKNACYYFCSFCLEVCNTDKDFKDETLYENAFLSLVNIIKIINDKKEKGKELTSNDFKSNNLFEEVLNLFNEK